MPKRGIWHRGWRFLPLLIALVLMSPAGARAQESDDEDLVYGPDGTFVDDGEEEFLGPSASSGEPARGYERFEVQDMSIGFRDDSFSTISFDARGVMWVSTYEGRTYKSTDGGRSWNEYTVLPEVKEVWGFSGQTVLLGALRKSGADYPQSVNLGGWGSLGGLHGPSMTMLGGSASGAASSMTGDLDMWKNPSIAQSSFGNGLDDQAALASGEGGIVLGAGLSNRAPRLSLLLGILNRPVANISMQRLLYLTAARGTYVRDVVAHPTQERRVFAGTAFGLYQSEDGGVSWVRAFAGMTPAERWIGHIVVDPSDPKRVYMGTSRGLFQSDDGGDNWEKNTKVPEISIRRVAIDPKDPNNVYVAGHGGMYRSNDRAANFKFAYYHSIPRRRDVMWMEIDPFDSNTAYLGTGDGLMRTRKLKESTISDWEVVSGLRTVNIVAPVVRACTKHPGHLYMMTRADLPTINYGANGPESLMLESWDHGDSWRVLTGNRTAGDIRWFTLDPKDPDTVWVALSRAIVKIERIKDAPDPNLDAVVDGVTEPVLPGDPSMGQVLRAALVHTELELDEFVDRLDSLRNRNWLPSALNLTVDYGLWNVGSQVEDIQFPDFRYLQAQSDDEWRVMAYANYTLPDFVYRQDSPPLMRFRELKMVEHVRGRIMKTIHRNYGELQRLKVRMKHDPSPDLATRINEELRIQYLEAIVDMTTGGYLSKWKKKKAKR